VTAAEAVTERGNVWRGRRGWLYTTNDTDVDAVKHTINDYLYTKLALGSVCKQSTVKF